MIIMLIRAKHIPVVMYNIDAMQIKVISCADIRADLPSLPEFP